MDDAERSGHKSELQLQQRQCGGSGFFLTVFGFVTVLQWLFSGSLCLCRLTVHVLPGSLSGQHAS